MDIAAAKRSIDDPNYNKELQEAMEYAVLDLLDQIGAAGWNKRIALKTLAEVVRNQTLVYGEDPDPEDSASKIDTSGSDADRLIEAFVDGRDLGP